MDESGRQRPTGRTPRLPLQETSDPDRKPLAQWVVSGKTVRPADEFYGADGPPPSRPPRRWPWLMGLALAFAGALAYFFAVVQ